VTDDMLEEEHEEHQTAPARNPHVFKFKEFVPSDDEDEGDEDEDDEGGHREGSGEDIDEGRGEGDASKIDGGAEDSQGARGQAANGRGAADRWSDSGSSEDDEEDEEHGEDSGEERPMMARSLAARHGLRQAGADVSGSEEEGEDEVEEMPFTLACPRSMEQLNEAITRYTRTEEDIDTLLHRILACNSLKLAQHRGKADGAGEARANMHEFYTVLLHRFEAVGDACGQQPLDADMETMRSGFKHQIDSMAKHLHTVTEDMSGVAAARWISRLLRAHRRVEKLLKDARDGLTVLSAWPTPGRLLLLQLAARIWPTSDRRHPVTTPAAILLGQCLAEIPVGPSNLGNFPHVDLGNCPDEICRPLTEAAFRGSVEWDLTAGAFCASLTVDWGLQAMRFHPEALAYLRGLLTHFSRPRDLPTAPARAVAKVARVLHMDDDVSADDMKSAAVQLVRAAQARLGRVPSRPLYTLHLFWLRHAAAAFRPDDDDDEDGAIPPLRMCSVSSDKLDAESRCAQAAALLASTYRSILKVLPVLSQSAAAVELLGPFDSALAHVRPDEDPALCTPLQELHVKAHEAVRAALENAKLLRSRKPPLRWQIKPLAMVQSVAPRMEETATLRKDKSARDREEIERRQLKRQIAREKRGAKRELRRDAEFLARERQREEEERRNEQRAQLRKNMAWLQEQQATVNLQVKKGAGLLKGGGSGVKKRPRVK